MNEHTPGPWEVIKNTQFIGTVETAFYIARVFGPQAEGTEEANARLIAAAPDLLEALRSLVCRSDVCEVPNHLQARAAIAKAEGAA